MTRKTGLLLCLAFILVLTGCESGRSSGKNGNYQPGGGVKAALEQGMAAAENGTNGDSASSGSVESADQSDSNISPDPVSQSETISSAGSAGQTAPGSLDFTSPDSFGQAMSGSLEYDIDLTALSETMAYSEVFRMTVAPEEYMGKTVKMKGLYAYYCDEVTGIYYFACVVQDASACCSQYMEFVLTDDYVFPDDYPELYEEICVAGVFDTYTENDETYCTLRNAVLLN